MAFITDNCIEDNENKFCSLWTTFQRIGDCANLFFNDTLRGDYFFNRLNNLRFYEVEDALGKALEICSKNKHVTGFFEPQMTIKNQDDDLHKGSTGVGFSIDSGITTTVRIFEADSTSHDIVVSNRTSGRHGGTSYSDPMRQ